AQPLARFEDVCQRVAPLCGLDSILLVEPHPLQLLPPPRHLVAAPRELLLRLEQLEPRGEPLFTCPGSVLGHRSSLLLRVFFQRACPSAPRSLDVLGRHRFTLPFAAYRSLRVMKYIYRQVSNRGSYKCGGIPMDSLITAAARALAAGDPLGALKRVALRDDAPALALRGIAMAQLGDLVRAKALVRRAARAFGPVQKRLWPARGASSPRPRS